jgi:AcrR family transcriptional regulator
VGYRHSSDEILSAAVAVALEGGMASLTFAKVAARLGISDRMVVYYFPSKPDLVLAVAQALGRDLEALLEQAFGAGRRSPSELLRRAWPVLTTEEADRVFAVYFEIVGLASAGVAPYDLLAPALVEGWVAWVAPRMAGRTAEVRRRQALAAVAQLDGLLLVRRLLGPAAADAAAKEAGVLR